MDDDGLRNWGYYEPVLRLMSPMGDHRDSKSFLSSRDNPVMVNPNGTFHTRDCVVSEAPVPMNYLRDSWLQREKFIHMLPGNPHFTVIPEPSSTHQMHNNMQPLDLSKDSGLVVEDQLDDRKGSGSSGGGNAKRRNANATPEVPKVKKPKKAPKEKGSSSVPRSKPAKKNIDILINGMDLDISGIPIPVCSCTGTPQQCYRWGCGGWQSACCTTTISMYPLPMSTKRRGARIAGRKMSQGAFKKVLEKLASEGHNLGDPIDLKTHWAKHGTNKFVTIR